MACDLLNLEWRSEGRDREVATAVCHALRVQGYTVEEACLIDYRWQILRRRPRVVWVADPTGARANVEAARFARELGLPAVTYTSEGVFREETIGQMFWGHMSRGDMPLDSKLLWSKRARELALTVAPDLAPRLPIVGGVGFDRYRLLRFTTRPEWMERHDLSFREMVGYAGWGFDAFFRDDADARSRQRLYGPELCARFRADRDRVREMLATLLAQNPEVLFLLKEHPGVVDESESELYGLDDAGNAMRVRDEEPIADCINPCSVWLAYESTTTVEAWLLDKPTGLLNPSGPEFPRAEIHRGSAPLVTLAQAQSVLERAVAGDTLEEFESRASERERIVRDVMQWADGRNHLRAAREIARVIDQAPHAPRTRATGRAWLNASVMHARIAAAKRSSRYAGGSTHLKAAARFSEAELRLVRERFAEAAGRLDPPGLTEGELIELRRLNGPDAS